MAEGGGLSFEYTPTWVVALVCFTIVFISFCAERGLHHLGKCFLRKNQDALYEALQKLKEELMLLGFISLLLTVFQGLISDICVPSHLATIMLPCKRETVSSAGSHLLENIGRRLLAEAAGEHRCKAGKVQLLSLEALHQLHIFIFVLAVVYVIFCATTMFLGGAKVREWRHWEHSIINETSRPHHGHATPGHLKEFRERAGRYWRKIHVVSWMIAFCKQFYGSVTKSDYIALRSGFIREHCPGNPKYNFHKYMLRTLEDDFRKIIGISWYLWLFVVVFLLMNIAGWHTYFWLSFLPLILLLIVGAKLEHIISQLAKEAVERTSVDPEGTVVKPSDELFWFNRPIIVLYLIHFILFQNSFEIAFFFWIVCTYGFKSCIMEELGFIIPRLVIGIIVQVLCSYSTLPLYTLVSQMGSMFKKTLFEEFTQELITDWFEGRKRSGLAKPRRGVNKLAIELAQGSTSLVEREITESIDEFPSLNKSHMPSSSL
ncbi:MLO-like protein 13 [Abeliophyllum distichum]|uniref:MLO-like protein n=1 Tax=Abeliophyllum distichum TaxID=126358 RepID=A0ABD1NTC7_9LAMI